jgi:hypothetical protein
VLQKIIVVPQPITERIKKLSEEIAELTEKNRRYSLNPKYGSSAPSLVWGLSLDGPQPMLNEGSARVRQGIGSSE